MKKTIFGILILLAGYLPAQDFAKDLAQVHKRFINAEQISYSIKYTLKAGHQEDSRLIMESLGSFCRNKGACLSVFEDKTTLVTQAEIIVIDRGEKRMRVKKSDGKPEKVQDIAAFLNLFSTQLSSIKTVPWARNRRVYDVYLKASEEQPVDHYRIVINTQTYYLESISLFYRGGLTQNEEYKVTGKEVPRLDITFYDFNNSKLNEETRSEYYYNRSSNKLRPTSNFKEYAIKEVF